MRVVASLACFVVGGMALAQSQEPTPAGAQPPDSGLRVRHEKTGVTVSSEDVRYSIHAWLRAQLRAYYPFEASPRTPEEFAQDATAGLELLRARVKIEGYAYRRWIDYYVEYDLPSSNLLDWRFSLEKYEWLQLRLGQWKVNYNRERVDSSGAQQLVDRSIVNREFTLDRQQGLMLLGRLWAGKPADFRYYFGVLEGNGLNAPSDDDDLMYLGRLQWNFFGRDLEFSQSDIQRREKPAGSLAFAAVRNTSPFTRFSSDGGGQLDGFEDGVEGQYVVEQWVEELAIKYRGMSLQHELHSKTVDDRVNLTTRTLRGGYLQAGAFPNEWWATIPAPLEFAIRYAFVDPDTEADRDWREELTAGANWFFAGHDNKLSADVSRVSLEQPGAESLNEWRTRLQWDVSF